jgi:hypothetical protein
MGRLSTSLLAIVLGAACAATLVSCGEEGNADLLPGDTASEITSNLDRVKTLAQSGECVGAQDAAQEVSIQIESLGGVDKTLKQALREGATRLNEVVASCDETTTEAVPPASVEEAVESPTEKPKKEKKPKKVEEEATAEETPPPSHSLPPQANGKGKGLEKGPEEEPGGEEAETEAPSGGIGPGAPAGEGE